MSGGRDGPGVGRPGLGILADGESEQPRGVGGVDPPEDAGNGPGDAEKRSEGDEQAGAAV